jgi:hypothetical protein
MVHLIDKDVLVAEIENLENRYKTCSTRNSYEEGLKDGRLIGYKDTLYKINILEVKEVDLDKEIELIKGDYAQVDVAWNNDFDFIAKHFFALGLKSKQC